ncbi:MAG: hypothetical protein A3B12_00500 [Candidatus Yanofskybacteria bacterium RIFCSPLOWO2_01_FULL_44_88]|nr:MAG: hypothetical protein A3B12_00500 [Candidatus Yanofskybacteria bacterium RIFCSPLOWO2_01_FULL_44_88]
MRRILITTGIFPPEIGGPATYALLLARHLSKNNKVTILTFGKKDYTREGFNLVYVSRRWPRGLRHLILLAKLFVLAPRHDVIFALNAVSVGWPSSIAARAYKKKFVVKIVGDYAWEMAMNRGQTQLLIDEFQNSPKTGKIGRLDRIQRRICREADTVIVPSGYLAQIVRGWGAKPEKIKVIYNGVDVPNVIDKQEAKKKIGISGNIILSVGRLVPWKGFKMLIKIMPKLFEINQFFALVIVGDGPEKSILESMVKNLGLSRKVHIVGRKNKEQLADYLAAADIFVLNTGYEGFSHQILEAMGAGLPVVTTAVGGNREVIHQGENGFMVKYNDEFNLIETIKAIWTVPEMRERFIEEGKKTIRKFSSEKMISETVQILT